MSSPLPEMAEEVSSLDSATESIEQQIRRERQLRYALLAEHQTVVRAKERQIRQLEQRLNDIRRSRWWRFRRWFITTVSAVWWIEDHKD